MTPVIDAVPLTGHYIFRETAVTLGGGTAIVLKADPNRVSLIFSALPTANIFLTTRNSLGPNEGLFVPSGGAPLMLDYHRHGDLVKAAWSVAGVIGGSLTIIEVVYIPGGQT